GAGRIGARLRGRERTDWIAVGRCLSDDWLRTRAAGAVALRITALDHEVGHDAVEREPVVEALARELDEPTGGLRRFVLVERDDDLAHVGVDRRGRARRAGRGRAGRLDLLA